MVGIIAEGIGLYSFIIRITIYEYHYSSIENAEVLLHGIEVSLHGIEVTEVYHWYIRGRDITGVTGSYRGIMRYHCHGYRGITEIEVAEV